MTTYRFFLDIIAEVSDNISEQSAKSLVHMFDDRTGISPAYKTDEMAGAAFWQTLIAFGPREDDRKYYQQGYSRCMSRVKVGRFWTHS
jgi:hypothetical protein